MNTTRRTLMATAAGPAVAPRAGQAQARPPGPTGRCA